MFHDVLHVSRQALPASIPWEQVHYRLSLDLDNHDDFVHDQLEVIASGPCTRGWTVTTVVTGL